MCMHVSWQADKIIFPLSMPTSDKFAKSIAYVGPSLWNSLDPEEQFTNDANTFKITLKRRLLESEAALYTA